MSTSNRTSVTLQVFNRTIPLWNLFVGLIVITIAVLGVGVMALAVLPLQADIEAQDRVALPSGPSENPASAFLASAQAQIVQVLLPPSQPAQDGIISGGDGEGFDPEVAEQGGTCICGWIIDVYEQAQGEGWTITLKRISPDEGDPIKVKADATGQFQINDLAAGTYKVTLTFPEGWREFTQTSFTVTLNGQADEDCARVRFKLEALANLVVSKVDKDHAAGSANGVGIPDWTIWLVDPATGNIVQEEKTDGLGKVYFYNIPPGQWTVVEEERPGWVPAPNSPPSVTLDLLSPYVPGKAQYYTFVNEQVHKGIIYVEKQDTDGNPLAGWEIALVRDDGTQPTLFGQTSPGTGSIAFTDLELGDYTVVEAPHPFWEAIDGLTSQKVTLDTLGEVKYVTFVNQALGCIDGYKINHLGEGLEDWEIKAYDSSSKTYSAITDDTGYFQIILPLGTWTVEEETREGWTPVTASQFTIEIKTPLSCERVRFKNRASFACIDVYKKDAHGDVGIPGWLIKLKAQFAEDSTTVSGITDGTGWVRFTNLSPGHYTIWEGEQPGWEAISPERYDLNLEATGSCVVVKFYNRQTNNPGPIDVPTPPPGPKWTSNDHYGCRGFYTVKPGDTLYRIATNYGTTWQAIQSANSISDVRSIYAGMQLCIP